MSEGMSAVLGRISQIQSLINPQQVSAARAVSAARPVADAAPTRAEAFDDLVQLVNGARPKARPQATTTLADRAISIARTYLGVPYRWGGEDPRTGLDCSGFTQLVFGQLGVDLPRTSAAQATTGTAVSSMDAARPGDLLFFNSPVSHVGIYLGEGRMIDAPKAGDKVRIRDVYETPSRIRRVLDGGGVASAPDPLTRTLAQLNGGAGPGATPYDRLFEVAGKKYGLDPALLSALARTESNYDASARSPAGALGLMQIMPGTARSLGVDPMVPAQAVDGAARYLADQLRTFGRVDLALAAYNAGPGAVRKYDGIPPYDETQNYVRRVQNAWGQLR